MWVLMEKLVTYPLDIYFTGKALRFVRSAKMQNPRILVNLEYYRPATGGCCGGGMSVPIPTTRVRLMDNGTSTKGFFRIESREGILVYIAKPAYEAAIRNGRPLIVDLGGFIRRTLKIKGLDLSHLTGNNAKEKATCH